MPAYRYPHRIHRRKHGPQGYRTPVDYREWLRDEFLFRCVYCLEREQWGNRLGYFHVEHFAPAAQHPDQRLSYDNLLYSCGACNLTKGPRVVPDPLKVFTRDTVVVRQNGSILGRTRAAKRLIELLRLDSECYRQRRRMILRILDSAAQADPELHRELLGFPDDLPDLAALKPPGGNTRPDGVKKSCHAQRERKKLPATY